MEEESRNELRRFKQLIDFKGKLEATSRETMEELANALDKKYKTDVDNSVRLHRLEFYKVLVDARDSRRQRLQEEDIRERWAERKQGSKKKDTQKKDTKPTAEAAADDVVSVKPEDTMDWKDLLTLSRTYYVMEHPHSEALTGGRRTTKKKHVHKFDDKDSIQWRVSQNFRLRSLEEWAQRRSDAQKLAEKYGYDIDEVEDDTDDGRDLEELFRLLDPSGEKRTGKEKERVREKPASGRPFKFHDEGMEDWTESYSDDSERSEIDDFAEEIYDFPEDEKEPMTPKEDERPSITEEEDISDVLASYTQYQKYKDPIFQQMDDSKILEDWFELYRQTRVLEKEKLHIIEEETEVQPLEQENGK